MNREESIEKAKAQLRATIDRARTRDREAYGKTYTSGSIVETTPCTFVLAVGYPGHAVRTQVGHGANIDEAIADAERLMNVQYRDHVENKPIMAHRKTVDMSSLPEGVLYPCAIAPSDVVTYSITDGGQIVAIHKITTKEGRVLWEESIAP